MLVEFTLDELETMSANFYYTGDIFVEMGENVILELFVTELPTFKRRYNVNVLSNDGAKFIKSGRFSDIHDSIEWALDQL